MGLRHACRSTESLGKQLLFLLDNMALVLGASKGRGSMPNLNHTCREICVISLATFIADGLRQQIIRPMSHLAPNVTARACTPMLTNVGRLQRSQPLTWSCLPSSRPKPHELPVNKRKLENNRQVAPALVSPTRIEEGWKQVRRRREERGRARARAHHSAASLACQRPLFGESSFLEQNRVTAATLNEFLAFAKMSLDELKLLAKLDEMVVEMLEHMYFQGYFHGAGDHLVAAIKFVGWIQNFSDLPAPHER